MEDTFKGITMVQYVEKDKDRVAIVNKANDNPVIETWWSLFPHLSKEHLTATSTSVINKQFLWVAAPPGIWVAIVRYENELIATNGMFPVDLEWDKVHYMLKEHGASLLCRASEQVGLVPVFVQAAGGSITPLAKGFGNVRDFNPLLETGLLSMEDIKEREEEGNWPNGMVRPYIIKMDSAMPLINTEARSKLIQEYDNVWLLSPGSSIYEVKS